MTWRRWGLRRRSCVASRLWEDTGRGLWESPYHYGVRASVANYFISSLFVFIPGCTLALLLSSVSCLFLFLLSAYFLTIFIPSSSPAHRYQPRTLLLAPPLHIESVGIIGPYLYFHATISFFLLVRFSLLRSRSRSHVCPYGRQRLFLPGSLYLITYCASRTAAFPPSISPV